MEWLGSSASCFSNALISVSVRYRISALVSTEEIADFVKDIATLSNGELPPTTNTWRVSGKRRKASSRVLRGSSSSHVPVNLESSLGLFNCPKLAPQTTMGTSKKMD